MRAVSLGIILSGVLLAGCDSPNSRIQSTNQGVFYTDLIGQLFKIEDGKLIKIYTPRNESNSPREFKISQNITGLDEAGFPVVVSGTLKIEGGFRKYKIEIKLGTLSNKQPNESDNNSFITRLREGNGRLTGIDLAFLDKEGFLAGDDKEITVPGGGWTTTTDEKGNYISLAYLSREPSNSKDDDDISTISVKWSSIAKITSPQPITPNVDFPPTPAPNS